MLRRGAFQKGQRTGQLDEFQYWYNAIRPHRHLNGLTPNEQWEEINPYRKNPRQVKKVSFWNGLLTGYLLNYK